MANSSSQLKLPEKPQRLSELDAASGELLWEQTLIECNSRADKNVTGFMGQNFFCLIEEKLSENSIGVFSAQDGQLVQMLRMSGDEIFAIVPAPEIGTLFVIGGYGDVWIFKENGALSHEPAGQVFS